MGSLSVDKYLLLDALKKHHCHVLAMEIISVLLLRLSALSLSVDKYLLLDALKKHHCHVLAMEIISVLLLRLSALSPSVDKSRRNCPPTNDSHRVIFQTCILFTHLSSFLK